MARPQRGDRVRVTFEGVLADPDFWDDFSTDQYRLADGRRFSRDDASIEILERGDEAARSVA